MPIWSASSHFMNADFETCCLCSPVISPGFNADLLFPYFITGQSSCYQPEQHHLTHGASFTSCQQKHCRESEPTEDVLLVSVGCQESFNKQPSPLHTPAVAIGGSASDISPCSYITLTLSQRRPLGSEAFALIMRVNPQTADTASISLPWCASLVDRA